jgi:hypothetical protein
LILTEEPFDRRETKVGKTEGRKQGEKKVGKREGN